MDAEFLAALGKIIMIDLVLGGDNAVVIAMACRNLPPEARRKGILWGTAGAVFFRVILVFFAAWLLQFPYLQLVGGALLFYIAVKLLLDKREAECLDVGEGLIFAVKTILFADVIMSLDNVLGIAAAAQGNFVILAFGLAVSIPIIVFGSTIILKIMDNFPAIIYIGAGVLGYVAGEMLVGDKAVAGFVHQYGFLHSVVPLALAAVVIVLGYVLKKRSLSKDAEYQEASLQEEG